MRFFFLRVLVNEATGNPQIVTTDPIYNYYDNKGIYEFTRTEFPEISDIKKLILDESAILNDILNYRCPGKSEIEEKYSIPFILG